MKTPRKSYKFDVMSLYFDGKYYFPDDIAPNPRSEKKNDYPMYDKPYTIQAVYYQGKWYQDTFYITEEFKNFIQLHAL